MSKLIDDLLALGFTYEDLYNKGILKEAAAAPEQPVDNPVDDVNKQEDPQPAPVEEPKPEPDPAPAWQDEFEKFKAEMRGLIQGVNLQNTVRKDNPTPMSVEDAILGIVKEK